MVKRYTVIEGDDNGRNERILMLDSETTSEIWDLLDELSMWGLNNIRDDHVIGWEFAWQDHTAVRKARKALKEHGYTRVSRYNLCPEWWSMS